MKRATCSFKLRKSYKNRSKFPTRQFSAWENGKSAERREIIAHVFLIRLHVGFYCFLIRCLPALCLSTTGEKRPDGVFLISFLRSLLSCTVILLEVSFLHPYSTLPRPITAVVCLKNMVKSETYKKLWQRRWLSGLERMTKKNFPHEIIRRTIR